MNTEGNKVYIHPVLNEWELKSHLTEFSLLKTEQQKRFETNNYLIQSIVLLVISIFGGVFIDKAYELQVEDMFVPILLCMPIIFAPLTFYAIHNEIIINRIGRYIHTCLRPKLQIILQNQSIWEWEYYHVNESRFLLHIIISFNMRLIYILPAVSPLFVFYHYYLGGYIINNNTVLFLLLVDMIILFMILIGIIYSIYVFNKKMAW